MNVFMEKKERRTFNTTNKPPRFATICCKICVLLRQVAIIIFGLEHTHTHTHTEMSVCQLCELGNAYILTKTVSGDIGDDEGSTDVTLA